MKKKLLAVLLALAASMPMTAQNLVKGNYGYLYCHMSDKGGGGLPTLFPVMVTTIRTSMAATLSSIQKSMPALKAEPVMPTSPACTMARVTSWFPPICAFARATSGITMVSIS